MALNPIIKFTTLFGLLAVELAIDPAAGAPRRASSRSIFFVASMVFVYRSFYGMRIETSPAEQKATVPAKAA